MRKHSRMLFIVVDDEDSDLISIQLSRNLEDEEEEARIMIDVIINPSWE